MSGCGLGGIDISPRFRLQNPSFFHTPLPCSMRGLYCIPTLHSARSEKSRQLSQPIMPSCTREMPLQAVYIYSYLPLMPASSCCQHRSRGARCRPISSSLPLRNRSPLSPPPPAVCWTLPLILPSLPITPLMLGPTSHPPIAAYHPPNAGPSLSSSHRCLSPPGLTPCAMHA